jgi:oxalate decarboxylase
MEQNKGHVTDGGSARHATIKELPVSKGLAGVSMRLNPGGIRELHRHAITSEREYYIKGTARMTVFGSDGRVRTEDFKAGDAGYVPRGYGHYLAERPADFRSGTRRID